MQPDTRTKYGRYVGFTFLLGLLAAGVSLFVSLFFGTYPSLDTVGVILLAASVPRAEGFRERGQQTARVLILPILAATLPYLAPQVPVMWLVLRHGYRLLLYDLYAVGLIIIAAWLYVMLGRWEKRWGRALTRTRPPTNVLRYPRVYLYVGILETAFFLGILILSNTVGKNETVTWWTNAGSATFVLLGLVIIIAYFRERYYVSEEGVSYPPPVGLGPRRFLRWDEVVRVDYSPWMQWVILEAGDGRKARIPILVTNAGVFLSLFRRRLPPDVRLSPPARPVLGRA